ncbi:MAG: hypothetical protein U0169_20810 [Polyangiaceae bacterium]
MDAGASGSGGSGGTGGTTGEPAVDAGPSESPTDAGGGTATGVPISPTDPVVVALNDPNRVSLPFECRGADIGMSDLRVLFERGAADLDFAAPGTLGRGLERGALTMALRDRSCPPGGACSSWTTRPAGLDVALNFHARSNGEIRLNVLDASNPMLAFTSVVLQDPDQVVAFNQFGRLRVLRLRMTRTLAGENCISMVGPALTVTDGSGAKVTTFEVGSTTFADVTRPGSSFDEPSPGHAAPYVCTGSTATPPELAAAWIPGGGTSSTLVGHARKRLVSTRTCHAVTGCTAWKTGAVSSDELLGATYVNGAFSVVANLPFAGTSNGRPTEIQPNVSAFGGTFLNTTVEGIVSATCMSMRTDRFEPVPGSVDQIGQVVVADRFDNP